MCFLQDLHLTYRTDEDDVLVLSDEQTPAEATMKPFMVGQCDIPEQRE